MGYLKQSIDINPTDFADYVFCGIHWAYLKSKWIDKYRSTYPEVFISEKSLAKREKFRNRIIGQENQKLCVEWVTKKYNIVKDSILFDGTANEKSFLPSTLIVLNNPFLCKPDLIIKKEGKKILFEFKSVGNKKYLYSPEFDSVHAQVWCYTNIEGEMKAEEFYLIRYYLDPFQEDNVQLKRLTVNELNPKKFNNLLELYSEAISILVTNDDVDPSDFTNPKYKKAFNPASVSADKARKCSYCEFNYFCYRGWKKQAKANEWEEYI